MSKKTFSFFLLTIGFYLCYAQTDYITEPETIIENQAYAVHSLRYESNNLDWTVSIFLLKGTNDTVWIFGMGFGETGDINAYYKNGKTYSSSGANRDASQVGDIIENNFGISKADAKLQFIVQHFHLDHVNQEFITALSTENFNLDNSRIFVHANDYTGSTCGKPCCGEPCDVNSQYYWAPYNHMWQEETLRKFETIGKANDQCDDISMSFESSYGIWKVVKARGHTSGAVNLSNEAVKLTLLGGERCQTPADWQVIGPHGNINIEQIVLSTNNFQLSDALKVFPVPSSGEITIQIDNPAMLGELVIYNATGIRAFSSSDISNEVKTTLPGGIYFIKYTDFQNEIVSTKKVIVE